MNIHRSMVMVAILALGLLSAAAGNAIFSKAPLADASWTTSRPDRWRMGGSFCHRRRRQDGGRSQRQGSGPQRRPAGVWERMFTSARVWQVTAQPPAVITRFLVRPYRLTPRSGWTSRSPTEGPVTPKPSFRLKLPRGRLQSIVIHQRSDQSGRDAPGRGWPASRWSSEDDIDHAPAHRGRRGPRPLMGCGLAGLDALHIEQSRVQLERDGVYLARRDDRRGDAGPGQEAAQLGRSWLVAHVDRFADVAWTPEAP